MTRSGADTVLELEQRGLSLVYCLGSTILFFSSILTVVAFFSPYWTQSDFEVNQNRFSNIGLWEVCFYRYRHIEINSFKSYTGCYWVWSHEIEQLRDWIMARNYSLINIQINSYHKPPSNANEFKLILF